MGHLLEKTDYHELFFCAYNRSNQTRMESTSGGIFSLLAEYLLQNKGVVFGASFNENQCVEHVMISSVEQLQRLRGAKYAPSSLKNTFYNVKEQLLTGKMVLFSGTPCQVVALKRYLKDDYDNLLLVDLVCHGVPSQKVWKAYLDFRKNKDQQASIASAVNMRSKSTGWSRYQYSVEFNYPSGFQYSSDSMNDSYMIAFVNNMILRPACNNCKFKGIARESDFTLGDFWGVWDYKPHMDDNKGTSLVIIHSEKAEKIWNKLKNKIICEPITSEQAVAQNPSILYPSQIHPKRDELFLKLDEEGWQIIEEEVDKIRIQRKRNKSGMQIKKIRNKIIGILSTKK